MNQSTASLIFQESPFPTKVNIATLTEYIREHSDGKWLAEAQAKAENAKGKRLIARIPKPDLLAEARKVQKKIDFMRVRYFASLIYFSNQN